MSGSALDRLFNNVETQKKPSQMPTLEEQLLEDDDDNDALFIEGMSESSRNALMAKVIGSTETKAEVSEEPAKKIEKVEFVEDEPVEEEVKSAQSQKVEKITFTPTKSDDEDDGDGLDLERPAEKPATPEEISEISKSQDDDVADEFVHVTKSKRGRKPKVKQDQGQTEVKNMDKNFEVPTSVGTIMHVLGVTMLQDLLKSNYKFREFGKEDTALIIKYLLSNLEGDK